MGPAYFQEVVFMAQVVSSDVKRSYVASEELSLDGNWRVPDGLVDRQIRSLKLENVSTINRDALYRFICVEQLCLSNCPLRDEQLKNIPLFPHLKELRLEQCPAITAKGVTSLVRTIAIKYLFISGCRQLSEDRLDLRRSLALESIQFLEEQRPLKEVVKIDVASDENIERTVRENSDCEVLTMGAGRWESVSRTGWKALSSCPLREISLWNGGDVRDLDLADLSLENFPKLVSLAFFNFSLLEGAIIPHICRAAPNLRELKFYNCEMLSESWLRNIAKFCPDLEELTCVDWRGISDEGIKELKSLPNLSKLHVSVSPRLTSASLSHFLDGFFSLKKFFFNLEKSAVSLEALDLFAEQLEQLQEGRCIMATEAGIFFSDRKIDSVSSLSLSQSSVQSQRRGSSHSLQFQSKLTEVAQPSEEPPQREELNLATLFLHEKLLIKLLEKNPTLKKLVVRHITRRGFEALLQCHNLQSLSLYSCKMLTDENLLRLGRSCPNLEHVFLMESPITAKGAATFLAESKNLKKAEFSFCPGINASTLSMPAYDLPHSLEVHFYCCDRMPPSLLKNFAETFPLANFKAEHCSLIDEPTETPTLFEQVFPRVAASLADFEAFTTETFRRFARRLHIS